MLSHLNHIECLFIDIKFMFSPSFVDIMLSHLNHNECLFMDIKFMFSNILYLAIISQESFDKKLKLHNFLFIYAENYKLIENNKCMKNIFTRSSLKNSIHKFNRSQFHNPKRFKHGIFSKTKVSHMARVDATKGNSWSNTEFNEWIGKTKNNK